MGRRAAGWKLRRNPKDTGPFYVRFTYKGHRCELATGTRDPREAQEQDRRRRRVRSHEAHAVAMRALEAGLVLHGYDSIGEKHVTAGRDVFASGVVWFAIYEGAEKTYSEPAATAIARILVGTREVPGVLGTYPTWGAATVALRRAGLSVELEAAS